MALPFRRRMFLILLAMALVPTSLAVTSWIASVQAWGPSAGAQASLERVAESARAVIEQMDTTRLNSAARAAMRRHLEEISRGLSLARRAGVYYRYYNAALVVLVVVLGGLVVFAAVRIAGHLSRQLSRPIDELVGWTQLIRRHELLPEGRPQRGAPEFAALRQALRELPQALETARARELEAERLRAFREVARRVAHEIKNPLTALRIAVDQMSRTDSAAEGRRRVAMEVIGAETDRLERLAREFADFGRLPEGPKSEVDLVELLDELGRTSVPGAIEVEVRAQGTRRTVQGHYDPLRRAFANLLRNAAEAMGGAGRIEVVVATEPRGVAVTVADHGPGVPPELQGRVFEPYVTTKTDGTGLGLALVRQTIESHGGTVSLADTPGGGATFTVVFP